MALKQDVQQKNEATRSRISQAASSFRTDMLSQPWLLVELQERQLDPTTGILAELSVIPEQGGVLASGVWLTLDRRFFRFEALLSHHPSVSSEIEVWEDVTATTVINEHHRGTGKSFGWLAIEVLDELTTAV
jgi:hypothetical protein